MPSILRHVGWVLPSMLGLCTLNGLAWSATNAPLLWDTETLKGYNAAYSVAVGGGYTATAGQTYSNYCTTKGCGYDALLQIQDAATGTVKWSAKFDLNGATDINLQVAISGNVVITAGTSTGESTSGHFWQVVTGYDLVSGTVLWRDVLGDSATDYYPNSIAVNDGQVYVTGLVGSACVISNAATCRQFTRAYTAASGTIVFSLQDAPLRGGAGDEALSVAVSEALLFIGGNIATSRAGALSPTVRAYDVSSQTLIWEDVIADPDNGIVYQIAALGSRLTAIATVNDNWLIRSYDAATGAVQWTQTYSLLGNTTPLIYDTPHHVAMDADTVVVAGYGSTEAYGTEIYPGASRDWVVRAYDAATGDLLWMDHSGSPTYEDEADSGVVLVDGTAYVLGTVADSDDVAHTVRRAYDSRTGRVLWNDVTGRASVPPAGFIALSAADGFLTTASYVQGRQVLGENPPDSFGDDMLVRTYSIGDSPALQTH